MRHKSTYGTRHVRHKACKAREAREHVGYEARSARYTLGNSQSLCSQKNNKSTVFFNNRYIVSFIVSCCGKGTAIENEAIREAMEKNRIAALSKLDKTLPCLVFVCALLYFLFHYRSLASTDEATNQMLIRITVTIYKMRSN